MLRRKCSKLNNSKTHCFEAATAAAVFVKKIQLVRLAVEPTKPPLTNSLSLSLSLSLIVPLQTISI